jgi:hypothetical protein
MLQDGDVVTVLSKAEILPVAYFEGAVMPASPAGTPASQAPESSGLFSPVYNRIPYRFRQGETLRSALTSLQASISPMANLASSYVVREGITDPIPIDLAALQSGSDASLDIPMMPRDRIIIPTAQFFVAVYGDVAKPGNYSYAPSKGYRYYSDLAGFNDIEEIPKNIVILDASGKRRGVGENIEPGSRIYLTAARVIVRGAVLAPGSYPYRKELSVMDYENLAGGFDPEKNASGKASVFDSKGVPRKPTEDIQPGDSIFIPADRFSYNFGRAFPVFLSIVSVAASIVTIYVLLR